MYVCMYVYAECGTPCSVCNIYSLAPRAALKHIKINTVWVTSFTGAMLVYSKNLSEALQKLESRSLQKNTSKMYLFWIPQVCEIGGMYNVTQQL